MEELSDALANLSEDCTPANVLLRTLLSAAVVESKFRPELLPRKPMHQMLSDLIEVLLQI